LGRRRTNPTRKTFSLDNQRYEKWAHIQDIQGNEYSDKIEENMDKDIEEYERSINKPVDLSPTAHIYNQVNYDSHNVDDELTEQSIEELSRIGKKITLLLKKAHPNQMKRLSNILKEMIETVNRGNRPVMSNPSKSISNRLLMEKRDRDIERIKRENPDKYGYTTIKVEDFHKVETKPQLEPKLEEEVEKEEEVVTDDGEEVVN
jgi:hypothetical protein